MKKFIIYIVALLLSSTLTFAQTTEPKPQKESTEQTSPAPTVAPETIAKPEEDAKKTEAGKFEDGDEKGGKRKRAADHFIDKDGDGINDNRCNGFGVQRKNQKGKRGGKK